MIRLTLAARAALALGMLATTPLADAQTQTQAQTPAQPETQTPANTQAQPPARTRPCADRATVIERLETRFGETRQSRGLNEANGVVEIYASADTGSWTILLTTPDGRSCLLASGQLWEQAVPVLRPSKGA